MALPDPGLHIDIRLPSASSYELSERRLELSRKLLLTLAVLTPLIGLLPELYYLTPDLNDGALHLGIFRSTVAAIRSGANPLDFWIPSWLCGFPLFHYYQPGPYLTLVLVNFLTLGLVPKLLILRLISTLMICLFPLANDMALRWMGLPRITAAWAAFFSTMVSGSFHYGIELESFTWAGFGLYTQAFALPFLPLAIAAGWVAIRDGKKSRLAAGLLAAAMLSHLLYGYIAALSLAITPLVFVPARGLDRVIRGVKELSRLALTAIGLLAFFILPLALDSAYHAKSLYDESSKFDSHGAKTILTWLLSGSLLDGGRLPVVTVLALIGFGLAVTSWLDEGDHDAGFIAVGFVFWLNLYFGRPTWGALWNLMPLASGLHIERLSSAVHLFCIWLAALAAGPITSTVAAWQQPRWRWSGLAVILLLVLFPCVAERVRSLARNARLLVDGASRYDRDIADFDPILKRLREDPTATVHAGHSGNWGKNYCIGTIPVYQILNAEAIRCLGSSPFSWPLPTDFQFQYDPGNLEFRKVYDVKYAVTDDPKMTLPRARLILRSGRHRLWELEDNVAVNPITIPVVVSGDKESTAYFTMAWQYGLWPRRGAHARLLFGGEAAPTGAESLKITDITHFQPANRESPIIRSLFAPPGLFMTEPAAPATGSVSAFWIGDQQLQASFEMASPGYLLVKATFHPNWAAEIDGQATKPVLVTPGLMAIEVPAGKHELHLVYRPGWTKLLLIIGGLILAMMAQAAGPAMRAP